MRILLVSSGLKPHHFGGLPSHVEDVIHCLVNHPDVVVGYLNTGLVTGRIGTHLTVGNGLPCVSWNIESKWGHSKFWDGTRDPIAQHESSRPLRACVDKVLADFAPDIVHFHEFTKFPIGIVDCIRRHGVRLVFTAQDYFTLCPTVKLQRPDGTLCDRDADSLDCDLCSASSRLNLVMQFEHASDLLLKRTIPLRNVVRRAIRSFERLFPPPPRAQYQERRRRFVGCLRKFDRVLVTSGDQQMRFRKLAGPGVRLERLPLSRTTFKDAAPNPRLRTVESGKIVFLALNIVNHAKGLSVLEETFGELVKTHPQAILHVHGMRSGERPGIRMFGPYEDSELDRIIASADFGIIPSLWPEVYGYVGPEMLSRGLPVIASSRGALPDYVIPDVNGFLFEPGNQGELLRIVTQLADSEEQRIRLWNSTAHAQRAFLSMNEHIARLLEIYSTVLGEDNASGHAR